MALLERIIHASSNPGDVVLDPFCGCGTAIVAAQKLGRRWIGIDITTLAVSIMEKRLKDGFPGIEYRVIGAPETTREARALALQEPDGRDQFQWWALGLVDAMPIGGTRKKGADRGIDGVIAVHHDGKQYKQVMVQVKSGHVTSSQMRDLRGVIGQDDLGLFITLEPPTGPMKSEASAAGMYHNPLMQRDYPRLQIITIDELMAGKKPDLPPLVQGERAPLIGQAVAQGRMLE